jgi:hypothetical protein
MPDFEIAALDLRGKPGLFTGFSRSSFHHNRGPSQKLKFFGKPPDFEISSPVNRPLRFLRLRLAKSLPYRLRFQGLTFWTCLKYIHIKI